METCLFTGEELTPTTKEEHTIPEALGGRIKSHFVTSSEFNNLSGTRLDFALKLPYEPLLNQLAPLLPRTSQPGRMAIDVPEEERGLVLEAGRVTRPGVLVVARDEKGLPKTALGEDEAALARLARSMKKKPEEMRLSAVRATEATTFYKKVPIVCHEIEIAALKSALLTFDHLLRGSPDRFTRHPDLSSVRTFIREAVVGQRIDPEALGQLSFGLQYEKRTLYDRLRGQISVPRTEFEHVLFVSSEARTKALELVWLVFGFDPFGFQLCPWPHGPFTYAVVNPLLREDGYSGPHRLTNPGEPLCEPTDLCSMPWNLTDPRGFQPVLDRISRERQDAYGRAVKLVEMTCDDKLVECFREAAALSGPDEQSVRGQVRARLIRMYGRKRGDAGFLAEVDAAIERNGQAVSPDLLSRSLNGSEAADAINWSAILQFYRKCLADLEGRFGLPGDSFTNSSGIVADPSDQRMLGKLPPMK